MTEEEGGLVRRTMVTCGDVGNPRLFRLPYQHLPQIEVALSGCGLWKTKGLKDL
jgi:hypothetical protein